MNYLAQIGVITWNLLIHPGQLLGKTNDTTHNRESRLGRLNWKGVSRRTRICCWTHNWILRKKDKGKWTYWWISLFRRCVISHVLYCSGSSWKLTIPSFWLIAAKMSPSLIYTHKLLMISSRFSFKIALKREGSVGLPSEEYATQRPSDHLIAQCPQCLGEIMSGRSALTAGYYAYITILLLASPIQDCYPANAITMMSHWTSIRDP